MKTRRGENSCEAVDCACVRLRPRARRLLVQVSGWGAGQLAAETEERAVTTTPVAGACRAGSSEMPPFTKREGLPPPGDARQGNGCGGLGGNYH